MRILDICRVLLGGALLLASATKIYWPDQFEHVIASYGIFPGPWVFPLSVVQTVAEIALGGLLVFGFWQALALCVTALLSIGTLLALAWATNQGASVDCLCLRGLGLGPHFSDMHMLRHGALATLAVGLLLVEPMRKHRTPSSPAPP